MMPIKAAESRVLTVLAARYPGSDPKLQTLNAARAGHPAHVFRAKLGPDQFVVAKLSDPALLMPYATRLIALHPGMSEGRLRVPEPYFHDAAQGILLMEDTWGQQAEAVFLQGGDQTDHVLQSAGAWIARFHAQSRMQARFNPDPHVNWIRKAIAAHKSGARPIPDCDGLRALLPALDALAETARGAMVWRAITHRDFHLRNLMIRKGGRVYGIDFENAARDECLRDLLFFLADCARVQLAAPTAHSLLATAQALRLSYRHATADRAVRLFFQLAFAMAAWAALDATRPPGPKRRRALDVIQLLATADDLFVES